MLLDGFVSIECLFEDDSDAKHDHALSLFLGHIINAIRIQLTPE